MRSARNSLFQILSGCLLLCAPLVLDGQTPPAGQAGSAPLNSLQTDLAVAQRGDVSAQLRVARAYNQGQVNEGTTVVRRNYTQAFKWFQSASAQGSVEAGAWLGSMYLLGHGVAQDVTRASVLIQSAAANSDPVGLRFAGLMFETGQGVPRNYRKAVAYYSQAVSKKDANAFDRLGMLTLRGLGVKRNPAQAFNLFTQGAALGDSWAQLNLGEMYYGGHVPVAGLESAGGTPENSVASSEPVARSKQPPVPDYSSALKFYSNSAAQGNRVAEYRLGRMYESGIGVGQDYSQAFELYRRSAHRHYAPALVALGQAHEAGRGTAVNLLHAYIAYNLAIEQNDPTAPTLLESLMRRLSPAQLEQAQASLEEYKREVARAAESD